MTEPATHDVPVVTPRARPQPRRTKDPAAAALSKRLRPFTANFMISILRDSLVPVVKDLNARISELETKNDMLERRHRELTKTIETEVFRYRGCWVQDKTYPRGSVATYAGGLWFCEDTSDTRPGTDGSWRLAVKRGAFDDKPRGKADR